MSASGTGVRNQLAHAVAALRQMPDGDMANTLVAETIPAVEKLIAAADRARGHLGCAITQIAASDDQIIADHMRDAHRVLNAALTQFEKGSA